MKDTQNHPTSEAHDHPHPHTEAHDHPHPHEETHDHPHPHTEVHDHPHPHVESRHHEHASGHAHDHNHDHNHEHDQGGLWAKLTHFFIPHSHTHYNSAQDAALASKRGIWAVKISLLALMITAIFQTVIVVMSGSVALFADTVHNFSDALTAIPLWLAFSLARRVSTRRFPYGYGRAEDISGVLIVLMILASAIVALYESVMKLIHPRPIESLGLVAIASIIGFIGNELVAIYRIRVGREIGSAALVADGLHARTDGITSLGVLAGAIAVWLGFPIADPLVGLMIGVAILGITWKAALEIGRRMMDSIDPEVLELIESEAQQVRGVTATHDVRARWVGHRQRCELHITVNAQLSTAESHQIAEEVRHSIFHKLPAMTDVVVHVDPSVLEGMESHAITAHHIA